MSENLAAVDWAAARGDKWRDHVEELESMLTPVDEPLIQALKLDVPCRVAEIGCGGGGTTLKILRAAPAGSVVHGYDISAALVEFARKREHNAGDTVAFAVADMATAPAPAQPYQRLVSRFGIMFFDNPHAAFSNLNGWLEPGGRFAFAVWNRSEENPWMTSVRNAVAEIVELPPPEPQAPGPFRYANVDDLLALLDRVGFGELHVENWCGSLAIGGKMSAEEAARFALASIGSFGDILADAGGDAFDRAHRSLTERFSRHQQDGDVRMDASVHIITGTRL